MRCAICSEELDNGVQPIFQAFHERCLPSCELCGKEIRADLCDAVDLSVGGKWTARHKEPCPD
jgi:hypothetical protein